MPTSVHKLVLLAHILKRLKLTQTERNTGFLKYWSFFVPFLKDGCPVMKMRENPFTFVTDGSNDTSLSLTTTSYLYFLSISTCTLLQFLNNMLV